MAQRLARVVRDDEAAGSSPASPTKSNLGGRDREAPGSITGTPTNENLNVLDIWTFVINNIHLWQTFTLQERFQTTVC